LVVRRRGDAAVHLGFLSCVGGARAAARADGGERRRRAPTAAVSGGLAAGFASRLGGAPQRSTGSPAWSRRHARARAHWRALWLAERERDGSGRVERVLSSSASVRRVCVCRGQVERWSSERCVRRGGGAGQNWVVVVVVVLREGGRGGTTLLPSPPLTSLSILPRWIQHQQPRRPVPPLLTTAPPQCRKPWATRIDSTK
jgi:hypothetical protein